MRRFTLRSRRKVSTQWRLFTVVHNIEKIARRGRNWTGLQIAAEFFYKLVRLVTPVL